MSRFSSSSDKTPIWAKILIVILIVAPIGVYWFHYRREYHESSEDIKLWAGGKLHIQRHSSQRVYHGGHGFGWGGGDPWEDVEFTVYDKDYRWEGPYIPIAIQTDQKFSAIYIVVYDRESEEARRSSGRMFRIYRNRGVDSWDEIAPKDFPKYLAIQNTWLRKNNGVGMDGAVLNEYALVSGMDPKDPWFCSSLTASLWDLLENPNNKTGKEESTESAVRAYKEKWIRPSPAYRPDGAPW